MTYADIDDFKAYAPEYATLADPVITALIEKAEGDVDNACGAHRRDTTTGLKFVPGNLRTTDADALKRATCAQAQYRQAMGPQFFIVAQYSETQGPDYNIKGKLPRFGPQAMSELERSGLLRLTTSWVRHGCDDPPWSSFAVG